MDVKTYLLQLDKKVLKQGLFLEDEDKNIVYEARVLKHSLLSGYQFDFINHITNKTIEHKVGNTITSEETGFGMVLSTKSRFKFDGKNIWDYLHDLGIRIDSNFQNSKVGMSYNVTLKDQELATIETSTPKGISFMTNRYNLRITCKEENLDLAFLVAFAIARTEQLYYD